MNGQLEFFSADDAEVLNAAEHFMCTNIEWDPTGRYVATSVTSIHQMENGFNIWLFNGTLLYRRAPITACLVAIFEHESTLLPVAAPLCGTKSNASCRLHAMALIGADRLMSSADRAHVRDMMRQSDSAAASLCWLLCMIPGRQRCFADGDAGCSETNSSNSAGGRAPPACCPRSKRLTWSSASRNSPSAMTRRTPRSWKRCASLNPPHPRHSVAVLS